MPVIEKSVMVPYTPKQMYALVNDIRNYPQFIPWCSRSEIISENSDEIRASLTLSHSGFEKTFTTVNRLQADKMIEIRLLEGPFKHLEGFWRFESMNGADCRVMLDMEFEFSNKIFAMMFGPVFHQAASLLVDAFHDRAKVVYGGNELLKKPE